MARMNDRGQLLLIGAITIAVLFVSLAVVLNGSHHTPMMSGDASEEVTDGDAATLTGAVRSDVATQIERAVAAHPSDASRQATYLDQNISVLADQYGRYYAEEDRVVDVDHALIIGEHVEGSGDHDGQFANGRFRTLILTPTSGRTDDFDLEVTDRGGSGDTWRIEVEATNRINVHDPGGGVPETCGTVDANGPVNVLNATVRVSGDVEYCQALDFLRDAEPPYEIRAVNPDGEAFDVELTTDGSTVGTNIVGGTPQPRLYGTTVTIYERSPELTYERTIRVAPGEPR